MSNESTSRRKFLRQLSAAICAGGASSLLPQLNLISSALAAPSAVPGYKALVCVYLAGGNDAWNLLMPYDQARYNIYKTSRSGEYDAASNPGGLAIPRSALAATTISHGGTNNYALHPSTIDRAGTNQKGLRSLYNQQKLALISNIGTLIQPISKAEYLANAALRPPQLYSHSDQERLWHIGRTTASARGWGGLVADRVRQDNLNQMLSPCISIGGGNRFEVGANTFPYQMSSSGVTNVSGTGFTGASHQRALALQQMLDASYSSPYQKEYSNILGRSRDLYSLLNSGLATGGIGNVTTDFPNESLANQLKMVARMIKLSRDTTFSIQHSRQIYYVRIGGFDMHDNLMSTGTAGHANLLSRVSQALGAFWAALGEIGAQDQVTTFTMSEFARTLSTNGNGSDHAWGSVNMILGGDVQGGRIYGDFPDQTLNGPVSMSRGQFVPSTSVDQMAATLARWMGVTSSSDLNTIFPNLANFSTGNLGFMLH